MSTLLPVALLGFDAADRQAIVAALQGAAQRKPAYQSVLGVDDARLVIVDAGQSEARSLLRALGRSDDAVFVSARPPLDPERLLRQLDDLLARREAEVQALATASRALLVDDSDIALHYLRRQLEPYGLRLDSARDSDRALDLLAQHAYGTVFLDLDLGDESRVDGLRLCQQIRTRLRHPTGQAPRVVMVSAFSDPVHRVRGTLAGAEGFLGKPLDPVALARLMQSFGLGGVAAAPRNRPRPRPEV
jgi:CheY-like chemotaxis protein